VAWLGGGRGLWLELAGGASPQADGVQGAPPPLPGGVCLWLVGLPSLRLIELEIGLGLSNRVVQRERLRLDVRLPEGRPARG
jgi:hypothetical protein